MSMKFTNEEICYMVEIEDFHILCYNETFKGLLSDLYVEVNILWKEIAMEDDSNLDPSGIELKEKLLNFFNKL